MSYGAPRQTPTAITDHSELRSPLRNCDGPVPSQPRTVSTVPSAAGKQRMRHTSATTAIAVTVGRNTAVRMTHRCREPPSSSRPSSSEPPVWPTASSTVCQRAAGNASSVTTCR